MARGRTDASGPEAKKKAIEIAVASIEKQFGKGSIMMLGEAQRDHELPVISTGSVSLDIALGIGGIPRGRVIETFGPESSGKTTLSLHVVAEWPWPAPAEVTEFGFNATVVATGGSR